MDKLLNSENVKTVVYLGTSGSFTEMAKDFFCAKYDLKGYQMPFRTIDEIIKYVDTDEEAVGVIPVENAKEGIVRQTTDNLITSGSELHILAETILPSNNCLLSKNSEIYNISGLIAPSPAIAKCSDYIQNELPLHLNVINTSSIEESARLLNSYNLTYAIIGTEKTAEIYNLNILNPNINNDKNNQTKFIMIGKLKTKPSEHSTSSIAIRVEDKPGALFGIVQELANRNINISYVHATPDKMDINEYILFMDIQGHVDDKNIQDALEALQTHTAYYKFMGSYERI